MGSKNRIFIHILATLFTHSFCAFAIREVCFEGLGCFTDEPPFDNAGHFLPNAPDVVKTGFLLHTGNKAEPTVLDYDELESIEESPYDASLPTKIIIHGFGNAGDANWIDKMITSFLEYDAMNVIVVDWGEGAAFPYYIQAVANSRLVARQIVTLLYKITEVFGATFIEHVHLIGHSIGAHIAGYVGADMNSTIGRITGLDPADPLFAERDTRVRLDSSDAHFVDVIHTNARPFLEGGYGDFEETGHVDFYVNGGIVQPGCEKGTKGLIDTVEDILYGMVDAATDIIACSHSRSHEIFSESINSGCLFIAYPCLDMETFVNGKCLRCPEGGCLHMGLHTNTHVTHGDLYFDTRPERPFCGSHYAINITTGESRHTAKGSVSARLEGSRTTSEIFKIFMHDNVHEAGKSSLDMGVVEHRVGEIYSIEITYNRYESIFFWKDGSKEWKVKSVTVTSGQTGTIYAYCGPTVTLTSNAPAHKLRLQRKHC